MIFSFKPTVDEKYPTLQILPLRYIFLIKGNFFFNRILVCHFNIWTTLEEEVSESNSTWIWTWSLSVLIAWKNSVGYFFVKPWRISMNSSFTYSLMNFRRNFVDQTMWNWCWYTLWLSFLILMDTVYSRSEYTLHPRTAVASLQLKLCAGISAAETSNAAAQSAAFLVSAL